MRKNYFCILAIALICCISLAVVPAVAQTVTVPGDSDGDKIVSVQELHAAEQGFKDGKINSEDLEKIRHIHEKYPRSIMDSSGRNVTIYKPIERIAVLSTEDYEILRTLKATDKVVAASKYIVQSKETGSGSLYLEGSRYANVGSAVSSVDYEALIKASPDVVITYLTSPKPGEMEKNLKGTGITIIRWDSGNISEYIDIVKKMGYLLDRNEEAEKYAAFFEEKLGRYLQAVKGLPLEEKPKVYLEADFGGGQTYYTCGTGHAHNALIEAAGANNIFSNVTGFKQMDPESVALSEPEVILRYKYLKDSPGIDKGLNDTSALEALRKEMIDRPELKNTPAVKNGRVYIFTWDCTKGGGRFYLGMGYIGKWLQPQIFRDYSPREVYQEYLQKFQGVDVDVVSRGVFVYPEA